MSEILLRPVRRDDPEEIDALHALNQQNIPSVGDIPRERMQRFAAIAARFTVVEVGGAIAAYLIALDPHADYASPNFIWFRDRRQEFLYVDRLAVATEHRRRGIGGRLYRDLEEHARGIGCPRIACEVNLEPRNEASLEFHRALGFGEVGRAPARGHLVAYLEWEL